MQIMCFDVFLMDLRVIGGFNAVKASVSAVTNRLNCCEKFISPMAM